MTLPRLPRLAAALLAALLAAGTAAAEANEATGLPLPRFVSLRANKANLRIGPGVQYPVEWVYQRSGVPLEVIAEHKNWRKIRDWEGAQGWLHQSMLSSKRAMIIQGTQRVLRQEPGERAAAVAEVDPGVVGAVLECKPNAGW
jgi:SH3-like domain-containing protein